MVLETVDKHKTRTGEAFRANVYKSVSGGDTLTIHIQNPEGSNRRVVITGIKVTTTGPFTIRRPIGATFSNGDSISVPNKKIGSDQKTVAELYQDSTYSDEDYVNEEYIGSGRGGNAIGAVDDEVKGSMIENEDFLVELENTDNDSNDASITVEYYETSSLPG